MQDVKNVSIEDKIANPAPLGLLGFGMTTVLLNIHNAGLIKLSIMILAMGLVYGGFAQLVAGIMEFKKGNTFAATAFTSYAMFWWSLVLIWVNPFDNIESVDLTTMGYYLSMWGFFTFMMFIATLKHNLATQIVFGSLVILFALLAIGDFTNSSTLKVIAGYEGIFCGASAIYAGLAQVINEDFGKEVMPLG